ncbi:class I SAM-dependent methyltransferase [Ruegeria marina]|uniref:Ubiquinone/menaquinone biosynthesis C-methylase UbiE n=1 Tax=Ruegeria marina TaxID=639004 RepID=A0A1G6ZVW3_9RHOB|nr:class I SAM-dependent methyltransferase [Ruegeria marina]SDE06669.1 Ubiquinone/menaquinone biosynthesis C-methylase UbiE [Ruegeria marina]
MVDSATFWDKAAEKYARTPIRDIPSYEYTLERTASYLRSDDRVLELGCGTGSTALRLAQNVDEIVATDIAPAMLAVGRRRATEQGVTNVHLVEATAENPPEGPFDAVLAFNLLHLVDDLDASLAAIRDRLKPGALFISKTFCIAPGRNSFKLHAIRLILPLMQLLGKAPPVRFLTEEQLDRAIIRAGFDLVEQDSFPATDPRRFLVARRR